jgi:hypothetical protein
MNKLVDYLNYVTHCPNSIDGIIIFEMNENDLKVHAQSDVEGGGVGEKVEKINWQPFIKVKEKFKEFHEVCHSLGETGEEPTRYLSHFERETVLVIEPYGHFLIIFVSKQGIGRVGFMEGQVDEFLPEIEKCLDDHNHQPPKPPCK